MSTENTLYRRRKADWYYDLRLKVKVRSRILGLGYHKRTW